MKKFTFILILVIPQYLCAQGFLKTKAGKIVDESGNEFLFKGIGLGGYLVPEGYMLNMSGFANSPTEIKNKIRDLIGTEETEKFFDEYRKNFVTREDIDSLNAWGFNSIRLPMHYELMTPRDTPYVYIEKGFAIIDSLISWCKPHNMYLILDLHAAPGGQNSGNISDYDPNYPSLWESNDNKLRTIDLWRHIAQRYKNEPTIGGYELLNETNWDLGANNSPLRQLFINITKAIRESDSSHIIFIEGNHYATDLSGLTPPWDFNMCYSFHKYWSEVTESSISAYTTIRDNYSVPLWMSESGENSNAWFTEFISLLNNKKVGWHWWTYKKFESISSILSVPIAPQFQQLLDYWNGHRSKPSKDFAITALRLQAENLNIKHCKVNKDVLDAMMRLPYDDSNRPFNENVIPGRIYATEYDYGLHNKAYHDKVYENTGNGAYNSGYSFRNDGVDIEKCSDKITNGYNVGWIDNGDWLKFSVNIIKSGTYDVYFRIAAAQSGGKIQLQLDNNGLTNLIDVPITGGWQNWQTLVYRNVYLPAGKHELVARFFFGGFNVNFLEFKKSTTKAEKEGTLPQRFDLMQNYPNPFPARGGRSAPTTTIKYSIPAVGDATPQNAGASPTNVRLTVYDILGRQIATLVNKAQKPGNYSVQFNPKNLPSGIYFYRLQSDNFTETKKMLLLK